MTEAKICVVCGADCAGRPRMKNSKGQYACQACVQARKRPRKAARPAAPAAEIAIAQDDAPAAGDDGGLGMDQFLGDITPADPNPCPKCGTSRAANAVVCMHCGFDSATGRSISTKVIKEKAKKVRSAPRMSSGTVFVAFVVGMLVLLPGLALTSREGAIIAALITVLWGLIAYVYMVGAAFRDGDGFWGILGVLFWVPIAGQFCVLAFVLYYCTIGSHRGIRKLNYWASVVAQLIVFGILFASNPDLLPGADS